MKSVEKRKAYKLVGEEDWFKGSLIVKKKINDDVLKSIMTHVEDIKVACMLQVR